MKNGMPRWRRVAFGLLLLLGAASAKAEAPAHCSYGYQDSSCLGPQYRAAQTPSMCSTDAGWTTLTPAKWIGSGFTQPACHYEAQPTCQDGYTQISPPVWDGSSWSAPSCKPSASPPVPSQVCTTAATDPAFTLVTPFRLVPFSSGPINWDFGGYGVYDPYVNIDISDAAIDFRIGIGATTADSWYIATYRGPAYDDGTGTGATRNGFLGICAIDPGGNLAGFYFTAPSSAN